MQQRIRMARLFTASLSLLFAIILFATSEWEVGLLVLALAALLFLRVYLVRDVPPSPRAEQPGVRQGGELPAPPAEPPDELNDDRDDDPA